MSTGKIPSRLMVEKTTSGQEYNRKKPQSGREASRVRKKSPEAKKLPAGNPDQHVACTVLVDRAIEELKSAFAEGLGRLTLRPLYAWSARYNIASGQIRKLLNLHGLIRIAAKGVGRWVPIQKRKVSDPGFQKFAREAEKLVLKHNAQGKLAAKAQKKKITRADRYYKRRYGHNELEDYGDTGIAAAGESTYNAVDRKVQDSSGLDSTRRDQVFGPGKQQNT